MTNLAIAGPRSPAPRGTLVDQLYPLPKQARRKLDAASRDLAAARPHHAGVKVWEVYRKIGEHPRIWLALAQATLSIDKPREALAFGLKALDAFPGALELLWLLGQAALQLGEDALAATWLRAAMQHDAFDLFPHRLTVLRALADVSDRLGDHDRARTLDRWTLWDTTPGPHAAHVRALTALRTGDYATAWPLHEQRFEIPEWRQMAAHDLTRLPPRWDGVARVPLVWIAEQGYGDTLQFARYLPWLAERSGHPVTVLVQPALVSLLADWPGVGRASCNTADVPAACRATVFAMSGAYYGGTVVPPQCPSALAWARPAVTGPRRVGVSWRGNAKLKNDADRSCHTAAEAWAPLWALPGIAWVALAPDLPEIPGVPMDRPDLPAFLDTARLIASLDAVVTVDSAPAHLALTLGCPTWVCVPSVPEWRWALDGASPWYPDAHLVRRATRADWPAAAASCAASLSSHFGL